MFSIPISEIRQFLFCPRIPFFHLILGIKTKSPIWVKQGKKYHKKQETLLIRRNLNRIGINENSEIILSQNIKSDLLNIHGIIDGYIIDNKNIIPFENKLNLTFGKPSKAHKLQLAAYSVCLEEKFNIKIDYGIIFFGNHGKLHKIIIDESLKIELNNKISELKKILKNELLPPSSATESKCTQCEYLNLCNDRF